MQVVSKERAGGLYVGVLHFRERGNSTRAMGKKIKSPWNTEVSLHVCCAAKVLQNVFPQHQSPCRHQLCGSVWCLRQQSAGHATICQVLQVMGVFVGLQLRRPLVPMFPS
jgi:hypothetical protein